MVRNKDLIGFKADFLAEDGDDKFDSLSLELEKKYTEIKYINDIIYVSFLIETDACGQYFGNILVSNDTINLTYDLCSDEVCTSLAIKKLTYLINNRAMKKFKIISNK